jgi:2-polyprenyl-3-methyl-5-hydroxy-6-metoxy-1,4-benzoquinol methylase
MSSPPDPHEERILRSWHANARAWGAAIQDGSIASRKLVTDHAMLQAIASTGAAAVLDVGCGEGWLSRALAAQGVRVLGVDTVPDMVVRARHLGELAGGTGVKPEFRQVDYHALARREFAAGLFDAAVCNFSLLGDESVESLLTGLPAYLKPRGHLVIQTLHPVTACGDAPYVIGWREGTWSGFSADFIDPAPWFFRTLEAWIALLRATGFELLECREPCAPGARAPSSVIFIARAAP